MILGFRAFNGEFVQAELTRLADQFLENGYLKGAVGVIKYEVIEGKVRIGCILDYTLCQGMAYPPSYPSSYPSSYETVGRANNENDTGDCLQRAFARGIAGYLWLKGQEVLPKDLFGINVGDRLGRADSS